MTKIEEIENEIRRLTPAELATFREWFLQFDAELWDRQIEADVKAGKLNKIADTALSSHRKGESSELLNIMPPKNSGANIARFPQTFSG